MCTLSVLKLLVELKYTLTYRRTIDYLEKGQIIFSVLTSLHVYQIKLCFFYLK